MQSPSFTVESAPDVGVSELGVKCSACAGSPLGRQHQNDCHIAEVAHVDGVDLEGVEVVLLNFFQPPLPAGRLG